MIKKYKFFTLFVVVVVGVLSARVLFEPGYFNMHDDLQMMRQLQMEKCFIDGQIPCRWVPDMGYGYGLPYFNYYPPLPYLVGQGIRTIGLSFVDTAKALFALSLILSGLGMYWLAKNFFGKLGGVLSAVFYIWAPYRAVDVYVRGAMNESWAFVFLPLIFLGIYKTITSKNSFWILLLALSGFGLLTSHNIIVMISFPFIIVWALMWLYLHGFGRTAPLFVSGVWAFCLAAFFSLPVLFEQDLVTVGSLTQDALFYGAHFVSIGQMFVSRYWGYGGSTFGVEGDMMSFQIGHLHWLLALGVAGGVFLKYKRGKISKDKALLIFFLLFSGLASTFMMHERSIFIWKLVSPLQFTQFPWRFLTMVVFFFSFLLGYLSKLVENRLLIIGVILLVLVLNWNYFRPQSLGPLTDEQKFSGLAWELQQKASITDFLPKGVAMVPDFPAGDYVEFESSVGEISNVDKKADRISFDVNVQEKAVIRVNTFQFPRWRVFVDGVVEELEPIDDEFNRIHFDLTQGSHNVLVVLENTMVRTVGNSISLVAWLGLFGYLGYLFKKTSSTHSKSTVLPKRGRVDKASITPAGPVATGPGAPYNKLQRTLEAFNKLLWPKGQSILAESDSARQVCCVRFTHALKGVVLAKCNRIAKK